MKIQPLNPSNGKRTIEIRSDELSFRALIRCLKGIDGVAVKDVRHNSMTDDSALLIEFRGCQFELYTPFSDYLISDKELCPKETWEALVGEISAYRVRWWEKVF